MREPLERHAEAVPAVVLWPAERFYWAEIDGMGWRGSGQVPPGVRLVVAEHVPVPIDDLHLVAVPMSGRLLVCGCPRHILGELDAGTVELKPAGLPPGLGRDGVMDRLNLLVGDCESPFLRARRAHVHVTLALTVLVCSLLLGIGLLRRAAAAHSESSRARILADAMLAEFGSPQSEDALAERATLARAVADAARKARPAPDAAFSLESLLKAWPPRSSGKPQSVSVGADGISMGVVVDGDPAPFLKAFPPPAGYVLDEPRLAAAGTSTRVSLHLRPTGGAK